MEKFIYIGDFTQSMKDYCQEKISKIESIMEFQNARIVLKQLPNKLFNIEISLDNAVRSSSTGEDFYSIIIENVQKILKQLKKNKKYFHSEKKHNNAENYEAYSDEIDNLVSREKVLIVNEMTINEAIDKMELLDHSFFIYRDIDQENETCVVYKRLDGTYGLIHCR